MKNKTLLLTLVFFFVLGIYNDWSPITKFLVILNAVTVLVSVIYQLWRLINTELIKYK